MNTLREAVHEYLRMRRHMGFKLHATERGLLNFVTFMEAPPRLCRVRGSECPPIDLQSQLSIALGPVVPDIVIQSI